MSNEAIILQLQHYLLVLEGKRNVIISRSVHIIKSHFIDHIHMVSRCYCECSELLMLLDPTVQQYLTGIHLHLSHLADALIQSDLQIGAFTL
jgi:hypothetical protein